MSKLTSKGGRVQSRDGTAQTGGAPCNCCDGTPCPVCGNDTPKSYRVNISGVGLDLHFADTDVGAWLLGQLEKTWTLPFQAGGTGGCIWTCTDTADFQDETGSIQRWTFSIQFGFATNAAVDDVFLTARISSESVATVPAFDSHVPRNGAGCRSNFTLSNQTECSEPGGDDISFPSGCGGSATVTPSDDEGECPHLEPVRSCKTNCTTDFCVTVWFYDGVTLSVKRWIAEKIGPKSWQALHPVDGPADDHVLTITCNESTTDPKWIITITDNNPGSPLGTVQFTGDATVCPDGVGLWELIENSADLPFVGVRSIEPITDPAQCTTPEVPPGCFNCAQTNDTGMYAATYDPGDGDPLEPSCATMNAFGLAVATELLYDQPSGEWRGTIGVPPAAGAVDVIIKIGGPSIGGFCQWNVIQRVWDGAGSADLSETFIGTAKAIDGSRTISFGPCTGTIKSKWNVHATMNPTGCWDGFACVGNPPDEQGACT